MKIGRAVAGVAPFEGLFSQWYGWAGVPQRIEGTGEQDSGEVSYDPYAEGAIRSAKLWAWFDAIRFAVKLR